MADIAYEVQNGVYKIENSAIKRAFEIAGITVESVLNGDSATMTLNEDVDGDGVAERSQEFTLTGGTETFDLDGYEVKQDNEIWVSFDFTDDGDITDAGRIENVSFKPSEFILGLTEIQNYLEDDWNDNRLTDREWRSSDISQGVFAHPDANEAGNTLIGRYRPEWNRVDPTTHNIIDGELVIPGDKDSNENEEVIATPSNVMSGTYKFDFRGSPLPSEGGNALNLSFISDGYTLLNINNKVYINIRWTDGGSDYRLVKDDSGTISDLISPGWTPDTNTHTSEFSRSSFGDYELFLDGVSQGTTTDTFDLNGQHCSIHYFDDSRTAIDNEPTMYVDNLVIN